MAKKKFYKVIASISLLGSIVALPTFSFPIVYADEGMSFSKLEGRWENGSGNQLVIEEDGGRFDRIDKNPNGTFTLVDSTQPGYAPLYIPAGVGGEFFQDSDSSRERIIIPAGPGSTIGEEDYYYRLTNKESDKTDFSKVSGTWKNEAGYTIVINADGTNENGEVYYTKLEEQANGSFLIYDNAPIAYTSFVPAGIEIEAYAHTDLTRDRLFVNGGLGEPMPYYRVDEGEKKASQQGSNWTGAHPYDVEMIDYMVNEYNFKYALYDIDGNGTPELLYQSDRGEIAELYTIVDGEEELITWVINEDSDAIHILKDGRIIEISDFGEEDGKTSKYLNIITLNADNEMYEEEIYEWDSDAEELWETLINQVVDDIEWQSPATDVLEKETGFFTGIANFFQGLKTKFDGLFSQFTSFLPFN